MHSPPLAGDRRVISRGAAIRRHAPRLPRQVARQIRSFRLSDQVPGQIGRVRIADQVPRPIGRLRVSDQISRQISRQVARPAFTWADDADARAQCGIGRAEHQLAPARPRRARVDAACTWRDHAARWLRLAAARPRLGRPRFWRSRSDSRCADGGHRAEGGARVAARAYRALVDPWREPWPRGVDAALVGHGHEQADLARCFRASGVLSRTWDLALRARADLRGAISVVISAGISGVIASRHDHYVA